MKHRNRNINKSWFGIEHVFYLQIVFDIQLSRKCFKHLVVKKKKGVSPSDTRFSLKILVFPWLLKQWKSSEWLQSSKKENYNNFLPRAFVFRRREKNYFYIGKKSCKQYRQQQKVFPVLREGKALTHVARERWKIGENFFSTFTNTHIHSRVNRKSLFCEEKKGKLFMLHVSKWLCLMILSFFMLNKYWFKVTSI